MAMTKEKRKQILASAIGLVELGKRHDAIVDELQAQYADLKYFMARRILSDALAQLSLHANRTPDEWRGELVARVNAIEAELAPRDKLRAIDQIAKLVGAYDRPGSRDESVINVNVRYDEAVAATQEP